METKPDALTTPAENSLLKIEKPIPQVSALLRFVTKEDPEAQKFVVEQSKRYESSYLAWELVRKLRAGTLVGQVFLGTKTLPYTGFEGYFSGLTPEEIVAAQTNLGTKILEGIRNFLEHEDANYTPWQMNQVLSGQMYAGNTMGILEYFDGIFAATLARARARAAAGSENFQRETYAQLARGHGNISYQIDENGINQTIMLPVTPSLKVNPSRVELKSSQAEGYLALAQIGRAGHPLIRSSLDYYRRNR